jgi:hypothetical protein
MSVTILSKVCTICKKEKFLVEFNTQLLRKAGYRSECKECQYKRQYKRVKKHPELSIAKEAARWATKTGKLKKPTLCEGCKMPKALDRHHPDYAKPLVIVWLCRKCHMAAHFAKN